MALPESYNRNSTQSYNRREAVNPPSYRPYQTRTVTPVRTPTVPRMPTPATTAAPKAVATTPKPATTAVTTPAQTAAPSYPWIDAAFKRYFDAIQQDFADRGLLDSTNKMGPMSQLAESYANTYAQQARQDNQQAIQNAMSLWELLTSGQLAKAQMALNAGLDANMNLPAQPSLFASIQNQSYLPPYKSSGPTGDVPTVTRKLGVDKERGEVIPSYTESYKNVAYRDSRADQAAQQALANSYLELARQQESRLQSAQDAELGATEATDDEMWAEVSINVMDMLDKGLAADDIIKRVNAVYGIDLMRDAAIGRNQRAQSILALLNKPFVPSTIGATPQTKATASTAGVPAYSPTNKIWDYPTASSYLADARRYDEENPNPEFWSTPLSWLSKQIGNLTSWYK